VKVDCTNSLKPKSTIVICMGRRSISVIYDTDAPRNQAWQVVKATDSTTRVVSKHRLKENAVSKARQIKKAGDSGVIWNKGMTGSKPL